MALHDYQHCGQIVRDFYVPIAVRASEHPPTCRLCGAPMDWIPQVGRMDALEPFHKFTAYVRQPDGSEAPIEIGSLHQMRSIERDSEQRARNGEGQQMVWRDYSQDRNHLDKHAFASDPSETPRKDGKVKVTPVSEDVAESVGYGPAVSDANTSALGE